MFVAESVVVPTMPLDGVKSVHFEDTLPTSATIPPIATELGSTTESEAIAPGAPISPIATDLSSPEVLPKPTDEPAVHAQATIASGITAPPLEPDSAPKAKAEIVDVTTQSEETSRHGHSAAHLRICADCCDHEIETYEQQIEKLKALKKSRKIVDAENPDDDDGKDDTIEADAKRDIRLTKIPNGHYREVKPKIHAAMDEASILLLTQDGGTYGLRQSPDDVQDVQTRRASHASVALEDTIVPQKSTLNEIPFRLVVNSSYLVSVLSKITGTEITKVSNVMVRPFKYLIAHERKIRDALRLLEDLSLEKSADGQSESDGQQPIVKRLNASENETKRREMNLKFTPRGRDSLRCLVDFMDNDMADIFSLRQKIADRSLEYITYDQLYHLYKPGDVVVADPEAPGAARRAYRVLYVTGGRPNLDRRKQNPDRDPDSEILKIGVNDVLGAGSLGNAAKMTPVILDCFYVDFDGESYGARPCRFIMPAFQGRRKVNSLTVYPLEFDPMREELEQSLMKRGGAFVSCAGVTHRQYTGRTIADATTKSKRNEVFELDCECVIDQKAALDRAGEPSKQDARYEGFAQDNRLSFGSGIISAPTRYNSGEAFDMAKCKFDLCTACTDMFDDSAFDLDARSKYVQEEELLERTRHPSEKHLILLPLRLFGYALHHREWFPLNINQMSQPRSQAKGADITSAFDDLVLPNKHKATIRALVQHQTRSFTETAVTGNGLEKPTSGLSQGFDLIRGKGRGLIILLHGPPGVGKTSTAESVAIQLKRPLLPITCGDLGTKADVVEHRLEDFFNLAAKWGCVVLLDEADVFLAKRVTGGGELERNGLVSVFLRQLEYYSGVLILTTNRVGEFDEAFISRIHMKLEYAPLNRQSTMEIWKMNIRRIEENKDLGIRLKVDTIMDFAEKTWDKNEKDRRAQWNGRQIKNAFQTAVALAFYEWETSGQKTKMPVLKKTQFKDVADTVAGFNEYIGKVKGTERGDAYAQEASMSGLRYDNEPPPREALSRNRPSSPEITKDSREAEIKELKRQLAATKSGNDATSTSSSKAAKAVDTPVTEDSDEDDDDDDSD